MKDTFEKKIEHETKFHDLTDEEYDRLDEKWTKNTPKVGPNGSGFFSQRREAAERGNGKARTVTIDAFSADYLMVKAIDTHKTPAELISEMIQERIAASS
ncbi:MAG: hypothetical protein LBH73_00905 [Spirochaetaceae bacterium]|jgi:hypothetical protein|nr:hypothetical protein [Spirochaetaceae bacterium]